MHTSVSRLILRAVLIGTLVGAGLFTAGIAFRVDEARSVETPVTIDFADADFVYTLITYEGSSAARCEGSAGDGQAFAVDSLTVLTGAPEGFYERAVAGIAHVAMVF